MKYEIAYISGSGNTEKLAHSISDACCVTAAAVYRLIKENLNSPGNNLKNI